MPLRMRLVSHMSICRSSQRICGKSSTNRRDAIQCTLQVKGEKSMSVPAAFDYYPATSVDEAISLLQQYGDEAKLLAGGHSLLPTMKLRLAQPGHLIDLGRISGLSYIREDDGVVAVGAMTRYVDIERSEVLKKHFALLPEGVAQIGDAQVRNRGTIGGSIAHSD